MTCVDKIRRSLLEVAELCGEASHIGGSLSMLDILHVLFGKILQHDPKNPFWDKRDIFILSKGHCALGYYAVLCAYGYFTFEKFCTFQKNGSDLIAHPVKNISLGIESSNGSLGQGLSYGLGIAIGASRQANNANVYVLLGDGECNEGSVWEAAALASEMAMSNLIAIVDFNKLRNDGPNTAYDNAAALANRWAAFGWDVETVDGHDQFALENSLQRSFSPTAKPRVVIANTIKGKGVSFMENNNDWHHNRLTSSLLKQAMIEIDSK